MPKLFFKGFTQKKRATINKVLGFCCVSKRLETNFSLAQLNFKSFYIKKVFNELKGGEKEGEFSENSLLLCMDVGKD
jgi:hypothetical protein